MSWARGRERTIRKEITFTPEEWERAKLLHEKWTKGLDVYRQWGRFARLLLMEGHVEITVKQPLTDPEPIAIQVGRIGVNVNQIAHWANLNEHITSSQIDEILDGFNEIKQLLKGLYDAGQNLNVRRDLWP